MAGRAIKGKSCLFIGRGRGGGFENEAARAMGREGMFPSDPLDKKKGDKSFERLFSAGGEGIMGF